MKELHDLADAVGVARSWHDITGADLTVSDEVLGTVLAALGYPCDSAAACLESLAAHVEEMRAPPAMLVTETGQPTPLPESLPLPKHGRVELVAEDGTAQKLVLAGPELPAFETPGYYTLRIGRRTVTLAVAPPACRAIGDFGTKKFWGPALQIPALRGTTAEPFGDFGDLGAAVRRFAAMGADAVMINPVHALFSGDGHSFSPYSPSSRLFFNTAMGAPAALGLPALPAQDGGALIDWETALPQRLVALRALFDGLDAATRARIAADSEAEGPALRRHALFDALDLHFRAKGLHGWRSWPPRFHNPDGAAAKRFAEAHPEEIEFHLFTQWLARESLGKAQAEAKAAGMAIGLLTDLAVGVHLDGSDAWALRGALLEGLTIGAPPDPLGPQGQNWGLTSFSPMGLRRSGYAPWIAMMRAALGRAGGMRIDHAFGLARLWVVPLGRPSSDGTYLAYPFADLIRLAALESHRAQALIVAEDLGTKPFGFTEAIAARQMLGLRVLWFERAGDGGFVGPETYPTTSVAVTGTHDTPTVAGWWRGTDLDWAEKLGRLPPGGTRAQAEDAREWDRGRLWATLGAPGPRPAPEDPAPVVAAALAHIGRTAAQLALVPLEDILALEEQPNLPGTIDEHPNWRRRLAEPLDTLLDAPETVARVAALNAARNPAA